MWWQLIFILELKYSMGLIYHRRFVYTLMTCVIGLSDRFPSCGSDEFWQIYTWAAVEELAWALCRWRKVSRGTLYGLISFDQTVGGREKKHRCKICMVAPLDHGAILVTLAVVWRVYHASCHCDDEFDAKFSDRSKIRLFNFPSR